MESKVSKNAVYRCTVCGDEILDVIIDFECGVLHDVPGFGLIQCTGQRERVKMSSSEQKAKRAAAMTELVRITEEFGGYDEDFSKD